MNWDYCKITAASHELCSCVFHDSFSFRCFSCWTSVVCLCSVPHPGVLVCVFSIPERESVHLYISVYISVNKPFCLPLHPAQYMTVPLLTWCITHTHTLKYILIVNISFISINKRIISFICYLFLQDWRCLRGSFSNMAAVWRNIIAVIQNVVSFIITSRAAEESGGAGSDRTLMLQEDHLKPPE